MQLNPKESCGRKKLEVISFEPEQAFSIRILHVQDMKSRSFIAVPVVDGWIQLNLEVLRVPTIKNQIKFFSALGTLVESLRRLKLIEAWHFVHKPPGIRLRFRSHKRAQQLVLRLLQETPLWKWPWLGDISFDSYFAQKELLSGFYEEDVNLLLGLSSDTLIESMLKNKRSTAQSWADFTVLFLNCFLNDSWWAWEALGRFERFRANAVIRVSSSGPKANPVLYDPMSMLDGLNQEKRVISSGFKVSTTLLVCLNYIYNHWTLDEVTQQLVIRLAREMTQPDITKNEEKTNSSR